jgi:hypothetical protein
MLENNTSGWLNSLYNVQYAVYSEGEGVVMHKIFIYTVKMIITKI